MSTVEERLVEQITTIQSEFGTKVYTKDSELYVARHLIGPPNGFKLVQNATKKNKTLPWVDGSYSNGINISDDGNTVSFKFQPPLEDSADESEFCEFGDVFQFLHFYYEYLVSTNQQNQFLSQIKLKLREIQYLLLNLDIIDKTNTTTGPQIRDAYTKAQAEAEKGKDKEAQISEL